MNPIHVTLLLPGFTTARLSQEGEISTASPAITPTSSTDTAFVFRHDLDREPWQSQLASMAGIETLGGLRLPSAALGVGEGPVVCADPIFLKADRDNATLIPPGRIGLGEPEADQLLKALNEFVAEDGLQFFRRSACAWYMRGLDAEQLASYPPSFLANRGASTFLPEGDGAAPWRRLMSEIQMLLHSHPVNQQRESSGLMPVNSVWFWGGAPLPAMAPSALNLQLFADLDQAVELGNFLNLDVKPLSAIEELVLDLPPERDVVIVDTCLIDAWLSGDATELEAQLNRVGEQWLEPLSRLVAENELSEIVILTEDGLQGRCNADTLPEAASVVQNLVARVRTFWAR